MMKRIVLFVLLVTLAAGMAFAQKKQKLGEAAAKELMEKVRNSGVPSSEVSDAIKVVTKYANDGKKGTGLAFTWPLGKLQV